MGNLLYERLSIKEPPCSYTGIDYFGPLFLKIHKETRISSGTAKWFGVVFTCFINRACYIDLTGDLSINSFLLKFHQFTSLQRKPHLIRSNNDINFVWDECEIREMLNKLNLPTITKTFNEDEVEWRFNTPLSPWMGGATESMFKLTKRAIRFP